MGTYRLCEQWIKRNFQTENPLWMAEHAQLKFVMTECSKTQIRLTGLICCGYPLESPQHMFYGERRGDSNEYPQHMFLWRTDEYYLSIIIKYRPKLLHWIWLRSGFCHRYSWWFCHWCHWLPEQLWQPVASMLPLVILSLSLWLPLVPLATKTLNSFDSQWRQWKDLQDNLLVDTCWIVLSVIRKLYFSHLLSLIWEK